MLILHVLWCNIMVWYFNLQKPILVMKLKDQKVTKQLEHHMAGWCMHLHVTQNSSIDHCGYMNCKLLCMAN